MRFIENGIFDKDGAFFFDNSRFDIYSYFIYFDSTAQYVDLAGLIDSSDATFSYIDQDYYSEFVSTILPLSENMFTNLRKFNSPTDFTIDSTNISTHSSLILGIFHFIDKINMYNQQVTKHDYYDHGVDVVYPFAEFVVIKLSGTDVVVKTLLNKHIKKDIGVSDIIYTLDNEYYLSKYLYHYSTYQSDYTNLFLKAIYNSEDYETVNKESVVSSELLYPHIMQDSTKLYMNITVQSVCSDVTNKYTLFDFTDNELMYINNKHLCRVGNIYDSTTIDLSISTDYTIDTTYVIEFLEFDTTDDLSGYMSSQFEYMDFTKIEYQYFFNIRTIKKLNFGNHYLDATQSYFDLICSIKTFFGYANRPVNEVAPDWKQFFSTASASQPITYSGSYTVINNSRFNFLTLLNSFFTDKFISPYDVTIDATTIENGEDFIIDLFITNSTDITNFLGNWVRNGIYVFNEGNIRDVMILKATSYSQIDPNTFRIHFFVVAYDSNQFDDLSNGVYIIPSNSYFIQYKYHIYNMIPYIKLNQFEESNDLNNLVTVHSFGYSSDNQSYMRWNTRNITI